ncbi:MAG: Lysine-tRNA ligase [Candidatus Giovannonibacteria bacterium GW2011_GWC2_44_8]|uniref:Lysine-tRNA ligase n=1 Tax=Candidatus Giovannonibacteria bacterium GW2011_GWC2_44_8 TaxID=1618657 RepID=A0A0G1MYF3_9BACT|nr:MAG: Lysine-tRNA ligase [Candidatus Giovannonibacteria bacterium GW2011_GWC2_44_8]
MQWLNKVADEVIARHPEGEILVSSGASPSGTYHIGHLREIVTCDAIVRELETRGRTARHSIYQQPTKSTWVNHYAIYRRQKAMVHMLTIF